MSNSVPSDNRLREFVLINRRFHLMLTNGVPILQALDVSAGEASPEYAEAFRTIRQRILQRECLGTGMQAYPHLFPAFYLDMIAEGEVMGTLDQIALDMANLLAPVARSARADLAHLDWVTIPIGLIRFTRNFAALLGRGIEWWRTLYILERESRPPFSELVVQMYPRLAGEEGWWRPIWQRMEGMPVFFSPCYTRIAQVGWEGHIFSETMAYLVDLLTEDWELSQFVGWGTARPSLLIPGAAPMPEDWSALTAPQQQLVTTIFCRAMAMLLSSGVPTGKALEAVAYLLPDRQRDAVLPIAQGELAEKPVKPLVATGFLSDFAISMLRCSELGGQIEYTLNAVADYYHQEITL